MRLLGFVSDSQSYHLRTDLGDLVDLLLLVIDAKSIKTRLCVRFSDQEQRSLGLDLIGHFHILLEVLLLLIQLSSLLKHFKALHKDGIQTFDPATELVSEHLL